MRRIIPGPPRWRVNADW